MYGSLYFELYGFIFALQLLISLIFFVIYHPRRKYFLSRASISAAGYFLLVTAVWAITRAINDGKPVYTPVFYFLVTLFLAVAVFCSFHVNILGAIYYATGAYAVQHAAYSVGNIIKLVFGAALPSWADILIFDFLVYCAVGAVFFAVFVFTRRDRYGYDRYDLRAFVISLCILVLCIVLSSSSDSIFADYINAGVDVRKIRIFSSVYAVIGCAGALVIQFGFLRENKLTEEKSVLDSMMISERKHHEMSKETIAIINEKCHDLKHQLALLEKLDDKEARKAYIRELGECIAFYDGAAETGNAALDIVISEKSLLCEKNGISFSCLADGKKLDFMSSTDIASLFGNAFDNAIEKQLSESVEMRFISLSVKENLGGVYVHMDNCCTVAPQFADGLPLTTKEDKENHGFGTKSIKNIVRKYDGELLMSVEDDRFNLDIMFPCI